ncbi:MAG: YbaB/EbfC family nucleoid-associated protein [Alphaproteobacteria bacterium]|nr:MAG: YbaB/EbfC family nucleoid-associated protein [Alphaproteobacteria bacterium]
MKNLADLMKQAGEMKSRMEEMQRELDEMEVEGVSGGGMVTVVINGKGVMLAVRIDPSLLKAEEGEILEDLIVAAHNDAKSKAETMVAEKTQGIMGGLSLPPGFDLPF